MRPRIFISHTDGDDNAARVMRERLAGELSRHGFEVLLDEQRLELGDGWRRELYVMMLSCHAGLILVSERALAGTPWMQFEASVLVMLRTGSALAANRPAFPVIPVLVPPVRAERFAGSWLDPLALDEIQSDRTGRGLATKIATRLAPLKASLRETPLSALQRVIGP